MGMIKGQGTFTPAGPGRNGLAQDKPGCSLSSQGKKMTSIHSVVVSDRFIKSLFGRTSEMFYGEALLRPVHNPGPAFNIKHKYFY
jgi:hypothetical protein